MDRVPVDWPGSKCKGKKVLVVVFTAVVVVDGGDYHGPGKKTPE